MSHEQRIVELGIELPTKPIAPIAAFVNARQVGNLLYISGQGPINADGSMFSGKVGVDYDVAQAKEHARLVGLNILAAVRDHCGTLDKVAAVVKLLGMVNAGPDFTEHPQVINGCSELLHEVFGEAGIHARSAVGMGSLPSNITVEIEAIFALND